MKFFVVSGLFHLGFSNSAILLMRERERKKFEQREMDTNEIERERERWTARFRSESPIRWRMVCRSFFYQLIISSFPLSFAFLEFFLLSSKLQNHPSNYPLLTILILTYHRVVVFKHSNRRSILSIVIFKF